VGSIRLRRERPIPELVDLLTELLAEANSGNLRHLSGVAEYRGEAHDYLSAGTPADRWAVSVMHDDLSREVTEDL
jgi:hypothetical protein